MALGWLSPFESGARRCILSAIADRRCSVLVGSFCLLLSVPGIAADVQVNSPDHNVGDQGNFTTQSETSLAVTNSLLVVGYISTKQMALRPGKWDSMNGYAYSINGGQNFTDGGVVPGYGNTLRGDPSLAFGPNGTPLYYASIGTAEDTQRGNKNAKQKAKQKGNQRTISRIFVSPSTSLSPPTFGAPVAIPGLTSGAEQDKSLIAVDTTESSFRGRVYVAWSEFPDSNINNRSPYGPSRVLFAASSSAGSLAFSATQELSALTGVNNHGAMPVVASNGDVYVVWSDFGRKAGLGAAPQTFQIVRSTDGGATFHNPDPADPNRSKAIASVTSTVGRMCTAADMSASCPRGLNIRTRGFPYIATDQTASDRPTHGNIYIVFQATPPAPATGRSQIFFTRSTDQGKTWDMPQSISNGPSVTLNADATQNDNWMPAIAVSPVTGHIRVSFYSRREDPQNIDIRLYDAGSTDGGLTWFNKPRSETAFKPSTGYDPAFVLSERSQAYMGDYISSAAVGSNFYAAWGDTRNKCTPPPLRPGLRPCSKKGRGDQDVFFSIDADQ